MLASMVQNQVQPTIDVSADQELFGPASLQLDSLKIACAIRRAQVSLGGVGGSAGVGQRVGESFPPCVGGLLYPYDTLDMGSRRIERIRAAYKEEFDQQSVPPRRRPVHRLGVVLGAARRQRALSGRVGEPSNWTKLAQTTGELQGMVRRTPDAQHKRFLDAIVLPNPFQLKLGGGSSCRAVDGLDMGFQAARPVTM